MQTGGDAAVARPGGGAVAGLGGGAETARSKRSGGTGLGGISLGERLMTPFGSRGVRAGDPADGLDGCALFNAFYFSSTDAFAPEMPSAWIDGCGMGKWEMPASNVERVARILQVVERLAAGESGDTVFNLAGSPPCDQTKAAAMKLLELPAAMSGPTVLPSGLLPGFTSPCGNFMRHHGSLVAATVLPLGTAKQLQDAAFNCCAEVRMWEKPPSQLLFLVPNRDGTTVPELCVVVCDVRPEHLQSTLEYNTQGYHTQGSPAKKVHERQSHAVADADGDCIKSSLSSSHGTPEGRACNTSDKADDPYENIEPMPQQRVSLSQQNGTLSTPRYQDLVDIPASILAEIFPTPESVPSAGENPGVEKAAAECRREGAQIFDDDSFRFHHFLTDIQETITHDSSPAGILGPAAQQQQAESKAKAGTAASVVPMPVVNALIRERDAMRKPMAFDDDLPVSQEPPTVRKQLSGLAQKPSGQSRRLLAKTGADECATSLLMPPPATTKGMGGQENPAKEGLLHHGQEQGAVSSEEAELKQHSGMHSEAGGDNGAKACEESARGAEQDRVCRAACGRPDEIKDTVSESCPAADSHHSQPSPACLQATQVYQPPESQSQSQTQNAAIVLEGMRSGMWQQDEMHDSGTATTQGSVHARKAATPDNSQAGKARGLDVGEEGRAVLDNVGGEERRTGGLEKANDNAEDDGEAKDGSQVDKEGLNKDSTAAPIGGRPQVGAALEHAAVDCDRDIWSDSEHEVGSQRGKGSASELSPDAMEKSKHPVKDRDERPGVRNLDDQLPQEAERSAFGEIRGSASGGQGAEERMSPKSFSEAPKLGDEELYNEVADAKDSREALKNPENDIDVGTVEGRHLKMGGARNKRGQHQGAAGDDDEGGRAECEEDGSASPPKKKRKRLPGCCVVCGVTGSPQWHDSKKHGANSVCDTCHNYHVNNAHVNVEMEDDVEEVDQNQKQERQAAKKFVVPRGKGQNVPQQQQQTFRGGDSQASSYLDSSQVYGAKGAMNVACPVIDGECLVCGDTESEGWYDGHLGPLTVCQPCYQKLHPHKDRHSVSFQDRAASPPHGRKRPAASATEVRGSKARAAPGSPARRPFQGGKLRGEGAQKAWAEEGGSEEDAAMACSQNLAERPPVQSMEVGASSSGRKGAFSGMSFIVTGQSECETRMWTKKERSALSEKIRRAGGRVISDPKKVQAGGEPSPLVVISCSPCKTFKYLAALAVGVQPIEPSWVDACLQHGVLLPVGTYGLAAGLDVETRKSYDLPDGRDFSPLKAAQRALSGVRVCAQGFETFSSEINQLLAFSGAIVCQGFADAEYLIYPQEAEERPSKSTLLQASARRIPVVSKDWLIQSLWEQRPADFKPFKIDDGAHLGDGDRIRLWSDKGWLVRASEEKLVLAHVSAQDAAGCTDAVFTVHQSAFDQTHGTHRFALQGSCGLFMSVFPDESGSMFVNKSRAQAAEHMVIKPYISGSSQGKDDRAQVTIMSWLNKYVTAAEAGMVQAQAKDVGDGAVFELEFV